MKKIAVAFATLLLLTGCGLRQGENDSRPSQPGEDPRPERYTTVVELKDALVDAGYNCPGWVQSDHVTKALQSGSCNDDDALSVYLDSAAVQHSIETLKGSGAAVSLVVGENWMVNSPRADEVLKMIGGTVVTSPGTTPGSALSSASSPAASIPPSASATPPSAIPTPAPATSRQTVTEATLKVGEAAHLANWDVTVLRAEHGEDDISYGWKVNVCYVAPSDLAENGRISVSDKPWSVIVQDLEGAEENPVVTIPIGEFERDRAYRPDYLDTTLALGECNLGWIGIVHGNPDLGWFGINYEPSTGERITWQD